MKKFSLYFLLFFSVISLIVSCTDDFSEEDALTAQQTITYSVRAYDPNQAAGVEGANVTVIIDGKESKATTNNVGVAVFEKVKIGTNIPVKIEKEGYTTIEVQEDIDPDNYRQSVFTSTQYIYALTGDNIATIKGKVIIQTDLTNDKEEVVPANTTITAISNSGEYGEIRISTTTDADGNYELKVPASISGDFISYKLVAPTLTFDQKIAINRYEGEPVFPATKPSIVTLKTVFNVEGSAAAIPSVRAVYATVPAPADATGTQAIISSVTIDNSGKVTDIEYSDNGSKYTGQIPVTVVSLFEGSGAVITDNGSYWNTGNLLGYSYTLTITNGGTGYPTFSYANRTYVAKNPAVINYLDELKSGEIRVLNLDYGTGTSREKEIK